VVLSELFELNHNLYETIQLIFYNAFLTKSSEVHLRASAAHMQ